MKEYKVKIESIGEVKEFVSKVNCFDFEIDLISGRYAIDAKSIMGLFSLDLSKELVMKVHTDDTTELEASLASFIVK